MEKKKPLILAPAGDYDCARAAVLAGADAIYMGLKKFNARERASNLDIGQLKDIISIAHSRGARVFVTMNTLLTDSELYEAFGYAAEIYRAGADALIVQDPGLAYILSRFLPELELHASTQMTTNNSLQLDFLKKLGISNVNFARELSAEELAEITSRTHALGMTAEIFVHGAYCISCSGICYMSSFISSQAGNRGKCLQPCRRRYSLTPDGEKSYFLSLKDNNALENLERILETGADSLKIEGRIKNYNYVYTTVSAWREKLDSCFGEDERTRPAADVSKVFNRGFSTGYFDGDISPDMFVESPLDQSMVRVGQVLSYSADRKELAVDCVGEISEGSRISIYTPENSFICSAVVKKSLTSSRFRIEIENLLYGKILKGQVVTLLPDQERMGQVKELVDELQPTALTYDAAVKAEPGKPLEACFSSAGRSVTVYSSSVPEKAVNRGLSAESIRTQFEKSGDSRFCLGNLTAEGLESGIFLPVKELNSMRREALEKLSAGNAVNPVCEPEHISFEVRRSKKIAVLVSSSEDRTLFENCADMIFAEGENWFPPFIPDSEIPDCIRALEKRPDWIVSDNVGIGLRAAEMGIRWIAGPMLNSTNSYAVKAYAECAKASGAFLSQELNSSQLGEISAPADFLLFIQAFGPVTMMTTRQCLIASAGRCRSGRNRFSEKCAGCSASERFYDEKNIPFHVVKTPGQVNRVFNDSILFLPEVCREVNADYILLDFRKLPFMDYTDREKKEIFNYFSTLIRTGKNDREKSDAVRRIAGSVTRGNFRRGF